MTSEILSSSEIITVDELSDRLRVSRATLFNWMQKGILSKGRHYFKQGRVLRFIWGADMINQLLAGKDSTSDDLAPVVSIPKAKASSPLNWDY